MSPRVVAGVATLASPPQLDDAERAGANRVLGVVANVAAAAWLYQRDSNWKAAVRADGEKRVLSSGATSGKRA